MSYPHEPLLDGLAPQLQSLATTLRREAAINQAIAEADPLGADEAFLQFPGLNERHDTEEIRRALEQAVAKAQSLPERNFIHWNAAIRDLSMLGASLVRFAIEPADCVPDFSETLLVLSADVAAQIPRDSFIDYTSRNPDNERERTFTSLPQEKVYVHFVKPYGRVGSCRKGRVYSDWVYGHAFHKQAFARKSILDGLNSHCQRRLGLLEHDRVNLSYASAFTHGAIYHGTQ